MLFQEEFDERSENLGFKPGCRREGVYGGRGHPPMISPATATHQQQDIRFPKNSAMIISHHDSWSLNQSSSA